MSHHDYGAISGKHACRDRGLPMILGAGLYPVVVNLFCICRHLNLLENLYTPAMH